MQCDKEKRKYHLFHVHLQSFWIFGIIYSSVHHKKNKILNKIWWRTTKKQQTDKQINQLKMNSDNHLYDCRMACSQCTQKKAVSVLRQHDTKWPGCCFFLFSLFTFTDILIRCFRFGFGSYSLSAYNIVEWLIWDSNWKILIPKLQQIHTHTAQHTYIQMLCAFGWFGFLGV